MSTIVTRAGKGSPLTHAEVDVNFTNLNADKLDTAGIALGSAASPTIKFTGDSNTGIYSPGADQLSVATGGVQRLRIDSAGNVNVTTASLAQYFGINATGTAASVANGLFAPTGNTLGFVTNVTERARIDSNGRLLVGTSSSSALIRAAFQANSGNAGGAGVIHLQRGEAAATITVDETLGVLRGTDNADNIGAEVIFTADAAWGTGDYPGRIVFSTTADGASTPTERMRIDNAGNITTSTGVLTLGATGGEGGQLVINNTTNTGGVCFLDAKDDTTARLFTFLNNSTLQIGQLVGTGGNVQLWTGATERARIDSSGRLLVGTSNSTALLGYNSGAQFAASTGTVSFIRNTADNGAPELVSAKSRGSSATPVIVSDGDGLCLHRYAGYDGAAYIEAARISAIVDGTPGLNDMPGRLVFSTTADGASSPTEKMRIDNAGNITWNGAGIKLTTGRNIASTVDTSSINIFGGDITTNTGANIELYGGTHATFPNLMVLDADEHRFRTANGATERMRIDSSGRLLVGTSSSITAVTFPAQVQTNSFYSYSASLFSADATGSNFLFLKSRNATTGSHTVVQANDVLGQTQYAGSDGTAFITGATISAVVDGTPGLNDMPGRLVFGTTADGASSPTERLRITNDGVQAYNQPAPAAVNATATLTVANLKAGIITSTSAAATDMTLPTGTDTQAGFSGTYDNMTFEWSVINTGPSLVRVLAGTAHTVVGSGSVATGTSGRFASRRTAANTFVTYRLT